MPSNARRMATRAGPLWWRPRPATVSDRQAGYSGDTLFMVPSHPPSLGTRSSARGGETWRCPVAPVGLPHDCSTPTTVHLVERGSDRGEPESPGGTAGGVYGNSHVHGMYCKAARARRRRLGRACRMHALPCSMSMQVEPARGVCRIGLDRAPRTRAGCGSACRVMLPT